ncbi:MAG TPA: hypothetical protein VG604_02930, partial [Candidatus Saccharimonadales bacterium]|nr:hypothetical protein [Candidatus Saccharimonadales bacterium]
MRLITPDTVPLLDISLDPHDYYEAYDIGKRTGLSGMQFADLCEEAAEDYPDPATHPYHWRGHMYENLRGSMRWAAHHEAQGADVNWPVAVIAPLQHDRYYGEENFAELGFKSKEQRSALAGWHSTLKIGQPLVVANAVARSVLKTKVGEIPETVNDVIEVEGDLDNTSDEDYEGVFIHSNLRFEKEKIIELGTKFSHAGFEDTGIHVLSTYVINLAHCGLVDVSAFTDAAASNILHWSAEIAESRDMPQVEYLRSVPDFNGR